ncbi:SDR family NAD(P)-dependent oxidoreductase [Photobacterium aphoticum]|uniref:SDR family NAD(P)-dependent oxidoreductase n=1 Tax=Photobacterium aphoticum TaxID=754436 RepID=UPI0009E5521A|nr:SDR family NAD(P)-dependent oxidoreductase [Photobacterium aphoticum]PSU60198.1 KR domain-containing protein [Photobacterium aphoticum]GHA33984.1 short-chain dehydrogenase [Photobacterium aphoticum]
MVNQTEQHSDHPAENASVHAAKVVLPKNVLITGASSGIGRQLALDYAEQGWTVFACGQNAERLAQLANAHQNIQTVQFDMTDLAETQAALQALPVVPALIILNAGTCEYIEHGEIDTDLFRRVFEVNVFGTLHCIQALQTQFDSMTHLVLMGSTASYVPLPRAEAYGASKAAIAYLANTLALDLEPQGVTVSLVSPGFVETPLTDKNDFPMPMRVPVAFASEKIQAGIAAKKREIHFPLTFSLFLKSIALLPLPMQLWVVKRMTRKSA